ncbi:MAG: hypothetical protein GWP06_06100 [Actinobacteria bacterium]|nr:hypothetical protein [Actinomycetota bacterium]
MKPTANIKELKEFTKLMNKMPGQVRKVVAKVLDNQAFSMKKRYIQESLRSNFTVRNPKFLGRQTQVNRAKPGKEVANNFSEVGMMGIDGSGNKGKFTALEEQQTGKAPEKKRTATTDIARGGSFAKKQRPSTRINRPFRRQSQFAGRSKKHRIFQMLRETQKQKLNFILKNGEGNQLNIPDGLYGWKGKNLKMLQSFKAPKAHKVDWMGDALSILSKHQGPFTTVFIKEMEKALRRAERG